jgi:pyruvate formate lyase activating enzyme
MSKSVVLRDLLDEYTMPAAAELVQQEDDGAVRCLACGHRCYIKDGKRGICQVRFNRAGELRVPGNYVSGLQVDPIEKKPFFHAFPGRDALSFGMLGCDLHCGYCQNWVTSQALRDDKAVAQPRTVDADMLVKEAMAADAPVVVSTYNEPLITADWAVPVFAEAREAGLVCGFVSNGNATPEVLDYIRPYVDLYKVDLKGFNERNYHKLGCTLKNVLASIENIKARGFWIEIVTLIVPGFNDDAEELREMAKYIAGVSVDIPWHVTAFHPDYKMLDEANTTVEQLMTAYDAGKEAGLRYIYPGNLPGRVGNHENTACYACGATLIERRGFYVLRNFMKGNCCPECDTSIAGVWEADPPRESDGSGVPRALRI